jgi:hypothetical protein
MKKRLGKFYITSDLMDNFDKYAFEYMTLFLDFDKTGPHVKPPEYVCNIHKEIDDSGLKTYSMMFERSNQRSDTMNEQEGKDLINSMGSLAEITALYFNRLVQNNVPIQQAATITATVMCETLRSSRSVKK